VLPSRAMRFLTRAIALTLLATSASADDLPKPGEFSATATVTSSQGTRSLSFNVVVTSPISIEQALPLKKILAEGGQQALLNTIRGSNRGRIRLGGLEYLADLVIAEKTKDGDRYCLVTSRTMGYEEAQEGRPSLDYPFTIIVFDVPEFVKGTGHIFTKAALYVDDEGHARAEQYEHDPGTLKDVKRLK
jgi:hypothetical protein